MTPLIDVVFLLLVFFMLASTFLQYSRIDVIGSQSGRTVSYVAGAQYVRVHADGRIDLNGASVAMAGLVEALNLKSGEKNSRVIVRPAEGANVQHLVSVLEAVRRSRIEQIIVAR